MYNTIITMNDGKTGKMGFLI